MVTSRKDHKSAPAPVGQSWSRIESWLEEHLPRTRASLRPGVSHSDLATFEAAIGRALPDDVRESWKRHDGQGWPQRTPGRQSADEAGDADEDEDQESGDLANREVTGVIYGQALLTLVDEKNSLSDRSALREWRNLASSVDAGAGEADPRAESFPADAVRLCYACRGWIPLHWDGNRNFLGIDLDPGPNGIVGQVINFGGDERLKYVLAPSWAQFLDDLASELESGNFVVDSKHKYGSFLLKKPRTAPLSSQYKAWSKAKLSPQFKKVAPAAAPQAVAAALPASEAEGYFGVIRDFFAAMNAWERHWLSVRPLEPFGLAYLTESEGNTIDEMGLRSYRDDEPIPEPARALREADGRNDRKQVSKLLQIGKHYKAAIKQKKGVYEKHCTAGPRPGLEAFEQYDTPAYDPAELDFAEAIQASPDEVIVVMTPRDGVVRRFHLNKVGGRWLIAFRDRTSDGKRYEKISI